MKPCLAAVALTALIAAAAPGQAASGQAASGQAGPPHAVQGAASKRQCFYARDVDGFAAQSEHLVNVRVGLRDIYQFEMFGPCPDVQWHERIALVSRGSDWICSGLDAEIIAPSPIGPQHCPVRNIHKLSPAEVAAMPKRARP